MRMKFFPPSMLKKLKTNFRIAKLEDSSSTGLELGKEACLLMRKKEYQIVKTKQQIQIINNDIQQSNSGEIVSLKNRQSGGSIFLSSSTADNIAQELLWGWSTRGGHTSPSCTPLPLHGRSSESTRSAATRPHPGRQWH